MASDHSEWTSDELAQLDVDLRSATNRYMRELRAGEIDPYDGTFYRAIRAIIDREDSTP